MPAVRQRQRTGTFDSGLKNAGGGIRRPPLLIPTRSPTQDGGARKAPGVGDYFFAMPNRFATASQSITLAKAFT